MNHLRMLSLLWACGLGCLAADPPAAAPTFAPLGLPALTQQFEALDVKVLGPGSLDLTAPAGSNVFISPDGGYEVDSAPRLLFAPGKAPFVFTARLRFDSVAKWDAGFLLIQNDPKHYAKCCLERDYTGTPRVVSVVVNERGDDCNGRPWPKGDIYLRIAGVPDQRAFSFYTSSDGKAWFLERAFSLQKVDTLRIGFAAQSPTGKSLTVHFTDLRFEVRALKDWWAGD